MEKIHLKLELLLQKLSLTEEESRLVVQAYLHPGFSQLAIGKLCGMRRMNTYRTIDRLLHKGFLQLNSERDGQKRGIIALPLQDIAKRIDRKSANLLRYASEIRDIDRFLKYPGGRHSPHFDVQKLYGDEAREAFFDLHYADWNEILFLGDFDTQADIMGYDFEERWFKKRIKRGLPARGVFSNFGKWTQLVSSGDKEELRTSKVVPGVVHKDWYNILPSLNSIYIFQHDKTEKSSWNMLKIISPEITQIFENVINKEVFEFPILGN